MIQEIFGVGAYIRAVAERLADAGYLVGAPDLFWRFAPNWEADHTEAGLGASFEKVQQLDFPKAVGDCVAALEHLGSQPGITAAPAVLGFCLGGTLAWGVAANAEPSCCVSYYGSGVPVDDRHDRSGVVPDAVPLRQQRSVHPQRGRRRRSARRSPAVPGSCSTSRTPATRSTTTRAPMFYNEAAANAAWAKTMAFLATHLPA